MEQQEFEFSKPPAQLYWDAVGPWSAFSKTLCCACWETILGKTGWRVRPGQIQPVV